MTQGVYFRQERGQELASGSPAPSPMLETVHPWGSLRPEGKPVTLILCVSKSLVFCSWRSFFACFRTPLTSP